MEIRQLFAEDRDIYRPIEKVITYSADQESRLKKEISEYIVTGSIEEAFQDLLRKMQWAMEEGDVTEIGVWVSGFYGSGKSSFTKYLGMALDDAVTIEGTPFLTYLRDRMQKPQTKALLGKLAKDYPAAVVMLDLASEMLSGSTKKEVSTVLYYKVLQEAGFSQNLKVAALERKLKADGRYEAFTRRVQEELNYPWEKVQNDALIIDSIMPELAHEFYPNLFKTPTSFNTDSSPIIQFENERVKEMIALIRAATGKDYVIFIIDELGQYVASLPDLILNVDGLAKNIKEIGEGRVWLIATAQQTLTEDDPRAALNSPELYKLQARFPIQIDLPATDIREICYRRLLGKSPEGEKALGKLFDSHGQALRFNTKLEDAAFYDSDFEKTSFINLYPFLPAHFDILLHLVGALAKSTGGIGLRSAIKIVQEILIEQMNDQAPMAEQPVGRLATTVTLYDALAKAIESAKPSIAKAVNKVLIRFPHSAIHQEVAKTVAVLQILTNMPITAKNVASLTHPSVDDPSRQDEINQAIEDLKSDSSVPFGEKDGNLLFFSEKVNEIDQERAELVVPTLERRRIFNKALTEVFTPLPSAHLHQSLSVTSGLSVLSGGQQVSLKGERETIQTLTVFISPTEYQQKRQELLEGSRDHSRRHTIFLLGRTPDNQYQMETEIYRSQEIANRHRNDPDQEVREYCQSQEDRATALRQELENIIRSQLRKGSFVFRGKVTSVESISQELQEAARKHLSDAAEQVYDRYNEAPVRVETNLAEKFLKVDLNAITSQLDPLGLVKTVNQKPTIRSDHQALVSIKDYLEMSGIVDGKRLNEHFTSAPFGWSPDTLRYLLAVLLVNGDVKLKISGREITVQGQQAIDALRTNTEFRKVSVALQTETIPPEVLARAADRLTTLTGENVIPLAQNISKAGIRHFPDLQHRYGALAERLKNLRLPGAERIRVLNQDIRVVLETDASDLPNMLGSEDSQLFSNLGWAKKVRQTLDQGLGDTVKTLQRHMEVIQGLPDVGIPKKLKLDVIDEIVLPAAERLKKENFYQDAADINIVLTAVRTSVADAVQNMLEKQREVIREEKESMQRRSDWSDLTQEEQNNALADLDALKLSASTDLEGLKALVAQELVIQQTAADLKQKIENLATERRIQRLKVETAQAAGEGPLTRNLSIPRKISDMSALNALIRALDDIRKDLALYNEIEITLEIED